MLFARRYLFADDVYAGCDPVDDRTDGGPADRLSVRTSYNVAALSFSPKEIAAEIKKHMPGFAISYEPDYRQKIANSWPESIDDSVARTTGAGSRSMI